MKTRKDFETLLGKKLPFSLTFEATGEDFGAMAEAEAYLKRTGYSVGSMQSGAPIGLAKGDAFISKWRNLGDDVKMLDGVLISDNFREDGVTIYLAEESPKVLGKDADK